MSTGKRDKKRRKKETDKKWKKERRKKKKRDREREKSTQKDLLFLTSLCLCLCVCKWTKRIEGGDEVKKSNQKKKTIFFSSSFHFSSKKVQHEHSLLPSAPAAMKKGLSFQEFLLGLSEGLESVLKLASWSEVMNKAEKTAANDDEVLDLPQSKGGCCHSVHTVQLILFEELVASQHLVMGSDGEAVSRECRREREPMSTRRPWMRSFLFGMCSIGLKRRLSWRSRTKRRRQE